MRHALNSRRYSTYSRTVLKIDIKIPSIDGTFAGTLDEEKKTIVGEFVQGGNKYPLTLDRVEKLPAPNRPQHPKSPYPYTVEEVKFENAAAKISLAGTLTLPKGDGPFAAVVLVTGSGPQDRDETIMEHKPFLVLADHLTRAGIAVLRYDDRGVAKSGGKFAGSTSADFATDAYAAVKFLQGRKEIDPKRIGICGHSEGGMIAPMVAAEHPNEVGFIVLLAGPGESGGTIIKTQNLDSARTNKATEGELKMLAGLFDEIIPLVASDRSTDTLKTDIRAKVQECAKQLADDSKRKELAANLEIMAEAFSDPWMRYFLAHDPATPLKKVKCPVLALNGAKDIQVRSKENLAGIAAALKAGGNAKFTSREFPELNHLFQSCNTGAVAEYGKIEETFNPEALKAVSEWIAGLGK